MKRSLIICFSALIAISARAATNTPTENTSTSNNAIEKPSTITVQEMLVSGKSNMRLHSLAMISQGGKLIVDESFLPGFKACSDDFSVPVRSITARTLGEHFIEGKENPNADAVDLLVKLAGDEAYDVRFSAVYYGLTRLQHKSPEILKLLIDLAAEERDERLYEQIADSLEDNREEVTQILDRRIEEDQSVIVYEIYEDLTGKRPADDSPFLSMPASHPMLFVFDGDSAIAESFKTDLKAELDLMKIENPDLAIYGTPHDYVVILKTYTINERVAVEDVFSKAGRFTISQQMWVTPEVERQLVVMRETNDKGQ